MDSRGEEEEEWLTQEVIHFRCVCCDVAYGGIGQQAFVLRNVQGGSDHVKLCRMCHRDYTTRNDEEAPCICTLTLCWSCKQGGRRTPPNGDICFECDDLKKFEEVNRNGGETRTSKGDRSGKSTLRVRRVPVLVTSDVFPAMRKPSGFSTRNCLGCAQPLRKGELLKTESDGKMYHEPCYNQCH